MVKLLCVLVPASNVNVKTPTTVENHPNLGFHNMMHECIQFMLYMSMEQRVVKSPWVNPYNTPNGSNSFTFFLEPDLQCIT